MRRRSGTFALGIGSSAVTPNGGLRSMRLMVKTGLIGGLISMRAPMRGDALGQLGAGLRGDGSWRSELAWPGVKSMNETEIGRQAPRQPFA
jgi:hypothetical protein